MFSHRLPVAEAYAALLAGPGADRGLMGPREVPRLWERHLLNCAVLTDLVADGVTVCDVGSGAGLPGLVMAIRRPDLRVTLVEPLLRRTTFLEEAVADLGLTNVEVVRGRAEQLHGTRTFDVVTSRAVAALDTLLAWSLPLAARDGAVLAMKGSSALDEIAAAGDFLSAVGAVADVQVVGDGLLAVPTTVVRVAAGPGGQIGWARAGRPLRTSSARRQKKQRRP